MSKSIKEYKVVYGSSPSDLSKKVMDNLLEGFEPIGSHQVVTRHIQNRFRGEQHTESLYELEYSQTLIKINNFRDDNES